MKKIGIPGLVIALVFAAGVCPAELVPIKSGPLKVGVATADITPQGPVWMGGFGARKKPSEGVSKPLSGQCVVFDNGATRVAFVAFDLCKIFEKQLGDLRAAAQKAGIPPQNVMINCSHTHSGPDLGRRQSAEYAALFKARTDPLFEAAVADLKPALLDYTVGSSTMAVNRRQLDDKGQCVGMRPEPRKQIDPDVPILRILTPASTSDSAKPASAGGARPAPQGGPAGQVRAVIFGYACHPSTMNDYRFTPDYVGYARDWVAAAFPGCVPVFLQGCGGDIKTRYALPNGRFGYVLLEPAAETAELGHELGRAVVVALSVPPAPVPADRSKAPQEAASTPIALGGIIEKVNVPDKKDPDKKSHPIYMGAWRIGDVYVFGSQCEVCSKIGLRIKRELSGLRVWTDGYTHWGGGYIPDAASYAEAGYEVKMSALSPATEDIVVGNAVRYVRTLQGGKRGDGPIPEPAAPVQPQPASGK